MFWIDPNLDPEIQTNLSNIFNWVHVGALRPFDMSMERDHISGTL
jgi:hypothetical protein